jgi:S1-C subfamily serine protease
MNCVKLRWLAGLVSLFLLAEGPLGQGSKIPLAGSESISGVLAEAAAKVVKIVGAGGYLGLEPHQTGILISRDGLVLTAWSHVLVEPGVTVILADGRRFTGEVLHVNPRLELALLKIDTECESWFDLQRSTAKTEPGTWVYALSNVFGIATGREPVSIQRGIIAGKGLLEGRRGNTGPVFRREVLFLDFVTSNPGAAGGAVIDCSGELVGLVGKPLFHERSRIWVNYAIPAVTLKDWLEDAFATEEEATDPEPAGDSISPGIAGKRIGSPELATGLSPEKLGFLLIPEILPQVPAYVEYVFPGSPAEKAGIKPDDLIVTLQGKIVHTCEEVRKHLQRLPKDSKIIIGIQRGEGFLELELDAQ